MRPILALLPLSLLALSCAAGGGMPRLMQPADPFASRLAPYLQRKDVTVAIAYRHLGTGATFFHNEDESLHAASTMKLPVMMALFQAVDAGEMRVDEPLPVRNEFQSIVDASTFSLDPKEDGDPELYEAVGSVRPLEELIRRMIVRSSNLATNLLIEKIGPSRATDILRSLGAYRMRVLRGVEDQKAFDAGLSNTATARDLEILLTALAGGKAFSASSTEKMLDILKAQEFNEKIPAYLPKGTAIAHKTGDITGIHHDAAIVYPAGEEPYVLVILTSGYKDEKEANGVIAEISRVIWQARGLTQAGMSHG
ncbi:MAG TPA: serine hydrolase [Thermoanaerobaculia bacterium]|nr:serine hydrolase [Thermoanaerobaculia bacterium]